LGKCVILLEDEPDLAGLVAELLDEAGYMVVHVPTTDALLGEAARRSPCVALLDSTNPRCFDLWHLGPKLAGMGVPPVAFTAHASARKEYELDTHQFAGIVTKPFDAEEFIDVVNSICWDNKHAAVS